MIRLNLRNIKSKIWLWEDLKIFDQLRLSFFTLLFNIYSTHKRSQLSLFEMWIHFTRGYHLKEVGLKHIISKNIA